GAEGHKDAVVAREAAACWPVGHPGLDHEPYRQINHTVRILTARRRQIGEVRVKVLAALRTVVLRIRDHEIPRTPQVEIPQVVERPLVLLVPIGLVTTTRTRLAPVGAAGRDELWRGQVGNGSNPLAGIGSIRPRTKHSCVLRARMLGQKLYNTGPFEHHTKPGSAATVPGFETITEFSA